jgi:hypothetical protein
MRREGMIVLHEGRVHAMRREGISAKGLGKETPQIARPSGRQQQDVRNFQTFNFHGRILIEFPVFYEAAGILACGAIGVNGA